MKMVIKILLCGILYHSSLLMAGPQSQAQLEILLDSWSLAPGQHSLHHALSVTMQELQQPMDFAYHEAQSRTELRQAMDQVLTLILYQQELMPLQRALEQTELRLRLLAEAIDVPLELVQPAENAWQQTKLAQARLQLMLPIMQQLRALEDPVLIMSQLERLWWLWQSLQYGLMPGQQLAANPEFAFDDDPVGVGLESLLAILPSLQQTYDQEQAREQERERLRFSF